MSEHSTQVFLGVAAFALHDGRMWWRSVFANNGFLKCSQNNVVGLRNIFCPIILIFNAVPSAGSKVMGTEHWETLFLNCWTVGNSEYIQKSLHSVLIYMLQCPKRMWSEITNEAIEKRKAKDQKRRWLSVPLFAASLILPPKVCSSFPSVCTNRPTQCASR